MKRRPLLEYPRPRYPGRDEGEREAALHLPLRWRTGSKVASAMALFVFPLPAATGCVGPDVSSPTPAVQEHDRPAQQASEPAAPMIGPNPTIARVFAEGEGRGAFGCVAIAPPAFLTEADARQVILEEFARVGVSFELGAQLVPELRGEDCELVWSSGGESVRCKPAKGAPLSLDGYDASRGIGFEYVTHRNYFELGGPKSHSTVDLFDLRRVADGVAARLSGSHLGRVGVFYDPLENDRSVDYRDPARMSPAKDLLRAQVIAFINWLKSEHVL